MDFLVGILDIIDKMQIKYLYNMTDLNISPNNKYIK